MKFTTKFDEYVTVDDRIETVANGLRFVATIKHDPDCGAPWEEEDGHGPVSDWRRSDRTGYYGYTKSPGELVLCGDRGSYRYYDFAAAVQIARKDGWGTKDGQQPGESKRAYAARAARADYQRLRDWVRDEWFYVGIVVTVYAEGIELGNSSLWGIESDSGAEYLTSVANDLLSEAQAEARETLAKLAKFPIMRNGGQNDGVVTDAG